MNYNESKIRMEMVKWNSQTETETSVWMQECFFLECSWCCCCYCFLLFWMLLLLSLLLFLLLLSNKSSKTLKVSVSFSRLGISNFVKFWSKALLKGSAPINSYTSKCISLLLETFFVKILQLAVLSVTYKFDLEYEKNWSWTFKCDIHLFEMALGAT